MWGCVFRAAALLSVLVGGVLPFRNIITRGADKHFPSVWDSDIGRGCRYGKALVSPTARICDSYIVADALGQKI